MHLQHAAAAIFQHDVKRLLAYSSVAQIGYIVLGIALANEAGLTSAIVHLFNHGIIKAGLFLVMGSVAFRVGGVTLDDMAGLGKRMPWTAAGFVICGLSLVGVPLTAGFISKWYLLLALAARGWWVIAAVVLLSSLLAVVYVWRVVEVMYFQSAPASASRVRPAPLMMRFSIWVILAPALIISP